MWGFTLHLATEVSEQQASALYERCSDCTLARTQGRYHIGFDRDANTMTEAIQSAIADVKSVGLEIDRLEVDAKELTAWLTA